MSVEKYRQINRFYTERECTYLYPERKERSCDCRTKRPKSSARSRSARKWVAQIISQNLDNGARALKPARTLPSPAALSMLSSETEFSLPRAPDWRMHQKSLSLLSWFKKKKVVKSILLKEIHTFAECCLSGPFEAPKSSLLVWGIHTQ